MDSLDECIISFKEKEFEKFNKIVIKEEKTRNEFLEIFPASKIKDIQIDDYVVGKGNRSSFCYWIETKLATLGSIKGGTTADKKFGIYYSKSKEAYISTGKWNSDTNIAINEIKNELYTLLEIGNKKDLNKISDSKISPMFRTKILVTYYPNDYLGVYSSDHVDYFLNKLNITSGENLTIEQKREKLLKFKENHKQINNWPNFVFMNLLYKWSDPRYLENTLNEEQIENIFNIKDVGAGYAMSKGLLKARKTNIKIVKNLKKIYDNRCQICGCKFEEKYGAYVIEGHHIEYFSKTQNNNPDNIIILCPNHHSIIHALNPEFNRKENAFIYPNGYIEKLKLVEEDHLN